MDYNELYELVKSEVNKVDKSGAPGVMEDAVLEIMTAAVKYGSEEFNQGWRARARRDKELHGNV